MFKLFHPGSAKYINPDEDGTNLVEPEIVLTQLDLTTLHFLL